MRVSAPLPAPPFPDETIDLETVPPTGGWTRWQVALGLGISPSVIEHLTSIRAVRPLKDGAGKYLFRVEDVRQIRAILDARREARAAAAALREARQAVKAAKAVTP